MPDTDSPQICRGRILLVEDDDLVRGTTRVMLEHTGYTVLTASTPFDALRLCEKLDLAFDLMITDVDLPRMSGIELNLKAKASRPDLKVLFMSGYPQEVFHRYGMEKESALFIQKPFNMVELLEKVQNAIEYPD